MLCIGTGWCAQREGHNNPQRSKLQNSPRWMHRYWLRHIWAQINDFTPILYHSDCDIWIEGNNPDNDFEVILSSVPARSLPYRHDWAASVLQGALYAYNNNMDYLYIEQDCLVHNLPAVLEFAKNHDICYGHGKYSMFPGWAENSLMWVKNASLPRFISRMVSSGIKDLPGGGTTIEMLFHNKFCDMFTPWPFGYGRIRPIGFTEPVFYAQQLTNQEIKEFMKLEGLA
jgi:hypothetical protein